MSDALAWVLLALAGLAEIGWAIGLKYSVGLSRPIPSLLTVSCMLLSVALLGLAVKTLPLGTGYAVWTGIGTVGTALFGLFLFGEPAGLLRLGSIALIVIGIVGLKMAG